MSDDCKDDREHQILVVAVERTINENGVVVRWLRVAAHLLFDFAP